MSKDIKVTDGVILESLNSKIDCDGGNYPGSGLEEYINTHNVGLTLFDTVLKDHVLTYPEGKGLALQGTYVYKDAIAGSRYGYPDFYNKCLEEYKASTSSGIYLKSNVTLLSGISDNEGILSGFSAGNYAELPVGFAPESNTWELCIKFRTPTSWSSANTLFYNNNGLVIQTSGTGLFNFYITSKDSESNYDICGASASANNAILNTDTNYWLKLEFTGSEYIAYISTNGIGYSEYFKVTSSLGIKGYDKPHLGVSGQTYVWTGSIDLNHSYININGERYWNGVETLKTHSNGHKFYSIDYKDDVDSIFNNKGSAWFYGIDEENERIFLPRNNYFEQSTEDISEVGQSIEAGLPNITGNLSRNGDAYLFSSATGALKLENVGKIKGLSPTSTSYENTSKEASFDASASNPIYGNSTTVQPNAVKKLLYICVGNTVSDTSWVDVVTQVEGGVKDLEDKTQEGIEKLRQSSTALTQTQITNCTTAITEKIKIEVDNGTLTLKAGSVVIEPQSNGTFLHRVVPEDASLDASLVSPYYSNLYSVCYNFELRKLQCGGINMLQTDSGDTFTSPDQYCLWYDTLNNEVKYTTDGGVTYEKGYSLPCCTANLVQGTGFTKTNEVFNGFGYIANHIYVDTGVETLIPNGRDVKRLAKNITHQTTNVRVYSRKLNGVYPLWLTRTGHLFISAGISYNANLNLVTNISNEKEIHYNCQVGIVTMSEGRVSKLEIFPPFQALDNKVPHIVEIYINGRSGYIVYSNGWCKQWGVQVGNGVYSVMKVSLLKTYKDTNYLLYGTHIYWSGTNNSWYPNSSAINAAAMIDITGVPGETDKTVGGFYMPSFSNHNWITEGFLAEGEY